MKPAMFLAFPAGMAAGPALGASLLWGLGFVGLALFAGTACAKGAGTRGTLVLIPRASARWLASLPSSCASAPLPGYGGVRHHSPPWSGQEGASSDASVFPLCAFLLKSVASFLAGSSFGTAGPLGVVPLTAACAASLAKRSAPVPSLPASTSATAARPSPRARPCALASPSPA
ncbi:MAG: hypothetical protein K6E40_05075 [Desulfovibrio sp.]|nr:hypothetical protein [Desulfovibrio sp.]